MLKSLASPCALYLKCRNERVFTFHCRPTLLLLAGMILFAIPTRLLALPVNVTGNTSGYATDPNVSVRSTHWWVTWLEYDPQLEVDAVWAVRYTNTQEAERIRVDAGDNEYLSPQVAALPDGGAWFTWVQVVDQGGIVFARKRMPGGWVGEPIPVSDLGASGAFPSIALDRNDNPCIAWEQAVTWGREIAAACWDGAVFNSIASPSSAELSAYEPILSEDSIGAIWAVWQERRSSNYEIMARRLVDGTWGASLQVTEAKDKQSGSHLGMHVLPKIAVGTNGQIWVAWISKQLQNGLYNGWVQHRRIQLRQISPSGGMSPIQQVPLNVSSHNVDVAQADGGADTVSLAQAQGKLFVFYRRLFSDPFRWDLQAQVSPVWSNQWLQSPMLLAPAPGSNLNPGYPAHASVEVTSGGVLAVWQADNRAFKYEPSVLPNPVSDIFLEVVSAPASSVFSTAGESPRLYDTPTKYDRPRSTSAMPHTGTPLVLLQGDLHAHSVDSHDGQGGNDLVRENIRRAHDNAQLHFFALTDHDMYVNPADWHMQQKIRSIYDRIGNMQALLGYEYTNDNKDPQGRSYGHQNVILRNTRALLFSSVTHTAPTDLWSALTSGDAFTIPHHTGDKDHIYTLEHFDERFVRQFEVFQERGSYECWCCKRSGGNGRDCVQGVNRNVSPEDGGGYFQNALAMGQRLGAIASPDHHGYAGLAGVYAHSNSREDIFEALNARRTFGVTDYSALMTVDVRADGHMMGEEYSLSDTCPIFYVSAASSYVAPGCGGAPATIKEIKLYRVTDSAPGENGEVLKVNPVGSSHSLVFYDANCPKTGTASYYVRAEQDWNASLPDPLAWSSPIFVSWDASSPSRDASTALHTLPSNAEVGETIQVSITMLNTGDITWTGLEQYGLAFVGDTSSVFQVDAVHDTGAEEFTSYGESRIWTVELTAPSEPGSYAVQWRMTSPAGEFGTMGEAIVEITEPGALPEVQEPGVLRSILDAVGQLNL